jgi:hypothetical protein
VRETLGLPLPVKLESRDMTFTVLLRHITQQKINKQTNKVFITKGKNIQICRKSNPGPSEYMYLLATKITE